MKKLLVVFGFAAISAMAADVTGYVMDKNCSGNKAMWATKLARSAASAAAPKRFWRQKTAKIYAISNQDKVKDHAGKKVTVTGKVEGESITVESVKM